MIVEKYSNGVIEYKIIIFKTATRKCSRCSKRLSARKYHIRRTWYCRRLNSSTQNSINLCTSCIKQDHIHIARRCLERLKTLEREKKLNEISQ